MTRERQKTIALSKTTSLLVCLLFSLGLHGVGITGAIFSDSMPPGLYRETNAPVARGQIVELRKLMKHVAAAAGDVVTVTPLGSYINGQLWPHSAPVPNDRYRPYPYGAYRLADGQLWLLGDNPLSWDSRYVGPFTQDMVNSVVVPLWTISNGYAAGTKLW
jgi:type IV secretory pathway protease TraF